MSATVLALTSLKKPFHLFARGVLTQEHGSWSHLLDILYKILDPIASEWPQCIQSIAAIAI